MPIGGEAMTDLEKEEKEFFDMVEDRLARWEAGDPTMEYAEQHHRLSSATKGFLKAKRKQIDGLEAIVPRSPYIQAAIDSATAVHDRMVRLHNRIGVISERDNAAGVKRLSAEDLRASFSDGWITPADTAFGTQAILKVCCNPACGAQHLYEYRCQDGRVQYRVYGTETDDAKV